MSLQSKFNYLNKIPVAGHRGNAKFFPENTLISFKSAKELNVDMIETDVHMTSDGELVLIHDHTLDRTTNGKGLVRNNTFEEIRKLDAGLWKGEKFRGEKVPLLGEMISLFQDNKNMLFDIELKDYPFESGEFAFESARKTIALLDKMGITNRCVINSWSGQLNEWLDETYDHRLRIHGYSPQERTGPNQKRFVYDYAFCVCLFGTTNEPVVEERIFRYALDNGVEPWVYYPFDSPEIYDLAISRGAMVFTSNDPKWAIEYLRSKGLHN